MKRHFNYQFVVGGSSILAGLIALSCLYVGILAVEYDLESFSNPTSILKYSSNYELGKWFNVLDMFGYYILLLPIVFYFHQQYKFKSPWVPLYTFCGCCYVLIGALGASILAAVWPLQMQQYLTANTDQAQLIQSNFELITVMVTQGMWNNLEVIFAAVWWLGLANLLAKDNKTLSTLSVAVGIATFLDALGTLLNISIISQTGMNIYLIFGIIWPVIVGFWIITKSKSSKKSLKINQII